MKKSSHIPQTSHFFEFRRNTLCRTSIQRRRGPVSTLVTAPCSILGHCIVERNTMSPAAATESTNEGDNNGVDLATLVLPPNVLDNPHDANHQQEAVLQLHGAAAAETSAALVGETIESGAGSKAGGISDTTTTIQAVIDLPTLSELARTSEEEFVVGLHRVATDHHYNPADSSDSLPKDKDDDATENALLGEEQPLLPAIKEDETAQVVLDTAAFVDTLANTLPVPETTFAPFAAGEKEIDTELMYETTTVTTEDNVNVELGHGAFLLGLPTQPGETETNYVLALPEMKVEKTSEFTDELSELSRHPRFPMLEKTMSMIQTQLPTDIKAVRLDATEVEVDKTRTELQLDLVVKRQVPFIGYVILICGFFALASVGTALDLQGHEVTPTMKSLWRVNATALGMFPFAALSIYKDGFPKLTQTQWVMFPLAALAYAQMTAAFVVALAMTSVANAFILSNLTSLILIVRKLLMGLPIVFSEVMGAFVGFTGAAVCAGDTSRVTVANGDSSQEAHPNEMLGNLIAASASFGMATYLCIAKDLRSNCDLYVFMFTIMFLSSIFILMYMMMSGESVEFSTDRSLGIFGWMTPTANRLAPELYMVFSCNFLGTMGYIAVLRYFDSVVVSTVMLMEPVAAAFFEFWAGLAPLPGTQTWIGDAIVATGSAVVIFSGSKTTEHIDATKAVRPRSNTIDSTANQSLVIKSS